MPASLTPEAYDMFMDRALDEAAAALARGDFPVGCVISDGERVVASGSRRGSTGLRPNELDHAEMMALRHLDGRGAALEPAQLTLFCTLEPCLMCFGAILLSGIREIVYAYEDAMGGGTGCDLGVLTPLYAGRRITVTPGIRRRQSLRLFQQFFNTPANGYWRDSYLAAYTLSQS